MRRVRADTVDALAPTTLAGCPGSRWRILPAVDFSPDLRPGVLGGDITVTFRLWQRPKVKVGGRYAVAGGHVHVDAIELVPFSSIDATDLRRSGEPDLESLRRRAAHAGPIHDDTLVYRIEFHAVR